MRTPPPPSLRLQPAPLRVVVAEVPMTRLEQFRALMLDEGWHVDMARMCFDRLYAYQRMALAHTSACDRLRREAVTLFADYERAPVPLGALH